MTKWETEAQFISGLNLCPNNKTSGGKLIFSHLMKKKPGLASQAFRHTANGLAKTENWLGDYFRSKRSKNGHNFAIVATARKIAAIFYLMVKNKVAFRMDEVEKHQQKYRQSKIAFLEKKIQELKEQVAQTEKAA